MYCSLAIYSKTIKAYTCALDRMYYVILQILSAISTSAAYWNLWTYMILLCIALVNDGNQIAWRAAIWTEIPAILALNQT